MLRPYLPILILLGVSAANAVFMVVLSTVLSPSRQTRVKAAPYESGMVPLGGIRRLPFPTSWQALPRVCVRPALRWPHERPIS
jgi:NADH:ubiquinone oxidoreductase subunit 3 (subunit A)